MATVINVGNILATTATGLLASTQYYYQIQAVNGTALGPLSAVQSHSTATGTINNLILVGGKLLLDSGKGVISGNNVVAAPPESIQGFEVKAVGPAVVDSAGTQYTLVVG